ncbi:MAG: hypothetical protein ABJD24_01795 [Acidimicrobiales bacterium]
MRDVIILVGTIAFFALCVGYVGLCDRIIGPDPVDADESDDVERETTTR